MTDSKFLINKRSVYYLLFFIAFIRPEYLVRISSVGAFYNYYRIMVVGITFLIFLKKGKNPNKFTWLWIGFESWIFLITVLRDGNISFAFNQMLTIITVALFWQMCSLDLYRVCKVMYLLLGFLIIVNFLTLIAFPNGMYVTGVTNTASENWFLGFKNKHMIYFLPFMGLSFMFGKMDGFNLKKIIMIVIVVISALYEQSSTTIVCLGVMIIVGLVPFIQKHYKIFNMFTYFGLSILMFIMIPLFRLQYLFSYLIVTVLHKSTDLTYRTDLWDRAFMAIQQHIVSGWGEQTNDVKHALYNSQSIISAHNQILEYLYTGGIVLLGLYIVINLLIAKKMHKMYQSEIVQVASGLYLALQIALIVEVYTDTIIYMIYFLLWYIQTLVIENSLRREQQNE